MAGLNYELMGAIPSVHDSVATVENVIWWGKYDMLNLVGSIIGSTSLDYGNSPTDLLRAGLLMGRITATGKLVNWNPAATDGSERIFGILLRDVKINIDGAGADRFIGPVMVGGPVKLSGLRFSVSASTGENGNVLGSKYENMVVALLTQTGRFIMDTPLVGSAFGGWGRIAAISENKTLVAADADTLFKSSATLTLTLPAPKIGLRYGVYTGSAHAATFAAASAGQLIIAGDAAADTVSLSAAIGGYMEAIGISDTKWMVIAQNAAITATINELLGTPATVAADGSGQGDAAAVTIGLTLVSAANGTKGVKLPAAGAGLACVIKNNANAVLLVYPNTSDKIDGGSANAAISVQPYACVMFSAYDATDWYSSQAAFASLYGAQTLAGAKTFSTMPLIPTATVAADGDAQSNAAAITTGFTLVSAADGAKGVKLPTAAAGLVAIVKNGANAVLKVYPNTSDAINALLANASLDIAAYTSVLLVAYDATTWYSVPLLPS